MLLPQAAAIKHCQRKDTGWGTWIFTVTQFRPSYVPMTISNKSKAICCCTRKGRRPPCIQMLQPSHLQSKGGESLLCGRRISEQGLSFTASCKTAGAAATQSTATTSATAAGTRLGKVKRTPFPAFLRTYVRGQQSPKDLTTQLSNREGK